MPAVDPKQLQTWAQDGAEPPAEEPIEEEMPEEEGDMEAGGPEKFMPIMEMLEEDADLIETACAEMDAAVLLGEEPLEPEDQQKLVSALAFLRPELVEGMKELMMDISFDEAMDLGAHLQEEEFCTDGDLVGGFLFHAKEALPEVTEEHHAAADALTEQAMASGGGEAGEEPMEEEELAAE